MTHSLLLAAIFCLLLNGTLLAQNIESLRDQKPFVLKGNLATALTFYNAEGKISSYEPFSVMLRGDLDVAIYGISAPVSFMITDRQRDFRQPLNRFGASPYYKWAKLHLGHRGINYSRYTLAGHNLNGAGIELTPGNFRFALLHGTLLKAIAERKDQEQVKWQSPSFKRTATIVKAGYGTKDNFLDLVFLKGGDVPNSLDSLPLNYNLLPSENMALALVSQQKIRDNWFANLEYAQSYFTSDVRTPMKDTTAGFMLKPFSSLYDVRNSTLFGSALDASLAYQAALYGLKVKFERVTPGYRSMGAYYFITDVQNLTLEPQLSLLKNKLNLSGSLGFQADNLDNRKEVTTRRTISSFTLNAQPLPVYTINAMYSNYGMGQKSGLSPVDTLLEIAQSTRLLGLNQQFSHSGKHLSGSLYLNLQGQLLSDANPNTSGFTQYNTFSFVSGYSAFVTALKLSIGINYIHTAFTNQLQSTTYAGPSVSLAKNMANNRLSLSVNGSIMNMAKDDVATATINTFSLRTSYRVQKRHRFGFRAYHNRQVAKLSGTRSFKETKGEINYAFTF